MKPLFIFLDESGNLDFSTQGTRYFLLTAVTALKPLTSSVKLQKLKYKLLCQDEPIQHFHASEDRQRIRNEVLNVINNLTDIRVNYIYAEKCKTHPSMRSNTNFYGLLGKTLLAYIITGYNRSEYDRVLIIFDKILKIKEQKKLLKQLKTDLKELGKPYAIFFHQTLSDFNGQIADYMSWAKYVSLERSEKRPLRAVYKIKMNSFDIFKNGTKKYY